MLPQTWTWLVQLQGFIKAAQSSFKVVGKEASKLPWCNSMWLLSAQGRGILVLLIYGQLNLQKSWLNKDNCLHCFVFVVWNETVRFVCFSQGKNFVSVLRDRTRSVVEYFAYFDTQIMSRLNENIFLWKIASRENIPLHPSWFVPILFHLVMLILGYVFVTRNMLVDMFLIHFCLIVVCCAHKSTTIVSITLFLWIMIFLIPLYIYCLLKEAICSKDSICQMMLWISVLFHLICV